MIFLLAGSLVNLMVIWWARRLPVIVLWLAYHAVLVSAFVRPPLITPGIAYQHGHLLPGPVLAGILAVLAIEAGLLASIRTGEHCGDEVVGAMKTAIVCFCSFAVVCMLAIVLMMVLQIEMY